MALSSWSGFELRLDELFGVLWSACSWGDIGKVSETIRSIGISISSIGSDMETTLPNRTPTCHAESVARREAGSKRPSRCRRQHGLIRKTSKRERTRLSFDKEARRCFATHVIGTAPRG